MYTRTLRFGMLGLAAIGLFGCSQLDANAPQTVMGKAYSYPLDQTLALQHIQVRGTHNSYHIAPEAAFLPFDALAAAGASASGASFAERSTNSRITRWPLSPRRFRERRRMRQ